MIVLFTDFGLLGPYTGQMKAVLQQMAPVAPAIDLFADAPGDLPPGTAFRYENSNGLAEIAVNQGRADLDLGLAVGSPVTIACRSNAQGGQTPGEGNEMETLTVGDVTVTSIVERDGPWRKPEDMFPAYDRASGFIAAISVSATAVVACAHTLASPSGSPSTTQVLPPSQQ